MTESDNYHDGTFTRWIAALSAAPCNKKAGPFLTLPWVLQLDIVVLF
jgi:hypothetical protein